MVLIFVYQATITKCYRLCNSNNRNLFSHSFEAGKPKIAVLVNLVSGESSLPSLQDGKPHGVKRGFSVSSSSYMISSND